MNTPSLDDPVRNGFDIRREMVVQLSETLLSTGGIDPMDGRHSPVYRDLTGLPPLLVQAAGRDICHDDSVRLAASARAAGVAVTITEYPDAEHIWILNGPWRIEYPQGYPQGADSLDGLRCRGPGSGSRHRGDDRLRAEAHRLKINSDMHRTDRNRQTAPQRER